MQASVSVDRPFQFATANAQRTPLTRIAMDLAAARWAKLTDPTGSLHSSEPRPPQVPALFQARKN